MVLPSQDAYCHSDHDRPALFDQALLTEVCAPCNCTKENKTIKHDPLEQLNIHVRYTCKVGEKHVKSVRLYHSFF